MKLVIDTERSPDVSNVEEHARFLHRKMYRDKSLPHVSAVTRALIPSWCDECQERAWGPILDGPTYCASCIEKKRKAGVPGF